MPSRSRQRQLQKLAARRQNERRRRRRQRILAGAIAGAVAIGGAGFAAAALLTGGSSNPSSTPTLPTSPPTTSTSSPSSPVGGVACGGSVPAAASTVAQFNNKFPSAPKMAIDPGKTYTETMVTSCGTITITLDAKSAPNTVNSIVFLAKQHYFDGSFFHRIVPNFVIQGGDPTGTGTGGPGYTTVDDPGKGALYPVGTLAMAKSQSQPSGAAGSQFFIVTAAAAQAALAPGGTGLYAIAGHVTSGMDVVQKIAAVPVGGPTGDQPQQKVYIESVTISVK